MKNLNNFLQSLVDKYWDKIEKQIMGCGFDCCYEEYIKRDIRNELSNFIDEQDPDKIDDAYENDTDDYVKYYAYIQILKLLVKEIQKTYNYDIETPKRFKQYYGPRD